ncbi:hypothetical protein AAY473_033525 [Plecturocebus cupreus]
MQTHFGRPKPVDHFRSGVRDKPGQHDKTPSLQKISQAWWCTSVVTALWEAKAGEWLEPRRQRLQHVYISSTPGYLRTSIYNRPLMTSHPMAPCCQIVLQPQWTIPASGHLLPQPPACTSGSGDDLPSHPTPVTSVFSELPGAGHRAGTGDVIELFWEIPQPHPTPTTPWKEEAQAGTALETLKLCLLEVLKSASPRTSPNTKCSVSTSSSTKDFAGLEREWGDEKIGLERLKNLTQVTWWVDAEQALNSEVSHLEGDFYRDDNADVLPQPRLQ